MRRHVVDVVPEESEIGSMRTAYSRKPSCLRGNRTEIHHVVQNRQKFRQSSMIVMRKIRTQGLMRKIISSFIASSAFLPRFSAPKARYSVESPARAFSDSLRRSDFSPITEEKTPASPNAAANSRASLDKEALLPRPENEAARRNKPFHNGRHGVIILEMEVCIAKSDFFPPCVKTDGSAPAY